MRLLDKDLFWGWLKKWESIKALTSYKTPHIYLHKRVSDQQLSGRRFKFNFFLYFVVNIIFDRLLSLQLNDIVSQ